MKCIHIPLHYRIMKKYYPHEKDRVCEHCSKPLVFLTKEESDELDSFVNVYRRNEEN